MSYETFSGTEALAGALDHNVLTVIDCLDRLRDGYTVEVIRVPQDTQYLLRQLELVQDRVHQMLRCVRVYAKVASERRGSAD